MNDRPSMVVLLGAGASVEAGLSTSVGLVQMIQDELESDDADKQVILRALRWTKAKLEVSFIESGQYPRSINIEDLIAAFRMLNGRGESPLMPFVSSWDPFIYELEAVSNESKAEILALDLIRAIEKVGYKGNGTKYDKREMTVSTYDFVQGLFSGLFSKTTSVGNLFYRAESEVVRILRRLLWINDPEKVAYLAPLVHHCKALNIPIATLNYDNTIELACNHKGIGYDIGLGNWRLGGRVGFADDKLALLKLHGSMDWEFVDAGEIFPHIGYATQNVKVHKGGISQESFLPAIICGAGNKLTARGPFLQLFEQFTFMLSKAEWLLCIGYSFGDDHINEVVFRWLNGDTQRRLLIIDPSLRMKGASIMGSFSADPPNLCIVRKGAGVGISEFFSIAIERRQPLFSAGFPF